jgi:hypothetical protein
VQKTIRPDTWIWIVVQQLDGKEQYLGQYDAEDDIAFIPAFYSKEDAQQCLPQLPRRKDAGYEVHAIAYDHLAGDAAANGFRIFMLDASGNVTEKMTPTAASSP